MNTGGKWSEGILRALFLLILVTGMALPGGDVASASTAPPPAPEQAVPACPPEKIWMKGEGDCHAPDSEWHFVINQVASEDLAPDKIWVRWDDGTVEEVPLDKFTGGVAHYQTTSHGWGAEVVEAWTHIYGSWDGQFNLSHRPCYELCAETTDWVKVSETEWTWDATQKKWYRDVTYERYDLYVPDHICDTKVEREWKDHDYCEEVTDWIFFSETGWYWDAVAGKWRNDITEVKFDVYDALHECARQTRTEWKDPTGSVEVGVNCSGVYASGSTDAGGTLDLSGYFGSDGGGGSWDLPAGAFQKDIAWGTSVYKKAEAYGKAVLTLPDGKVITQEWGPKELECGEESEPQAEIQLHVGPQALLGMIGEIGGPLEPKVDDWPGPELLPELSAAEVEAYSQWLGECYERLVPPIFAITQESEMVWAITVEPLGNRRYRVTNVSRLKIGGSTMDFGLYRRTTEMPGVLIFTLGGPWRTIEHSAVVDAKHGFYYSIYRNGYGGVGWQSAGEQIVSASELDGVDTTAEAFDADLAEILRREQARLGVVTGNVYREFGEDSEEYALCQVGAPHLVGNFHWERFNFSPPQVFWVGQIFDASNWSKDPVYGWDMENGLWDRPEDIEYVRQMFVFAVRPPEFDDQSGRDEGHLLNPPLRIAWEERVRSIGGDITDPLSVVLQKYMEVYPPPE